MTERPHAVENATGDKYYSLTNVERARLPGLPLGRGALLVDEIEDELAGTELSLPGAAATEN